MCTSTLILKTNHFFISTQKYYLLSVVIDILYIFKNTIFLTKFKIFIKASASIHLTKVFSPTQWSKYCIVHFLLLALWCWRMLWHSLGTCLGVVRCLLPVVLSPCCAVIWLPARRSPSGGRNSLTHFFVVLLPGLGIVNLPCWCWIWLISLSIGLGCSWSTRRGCRWWLCLLLIIVSIISCPRCWIGICSWLTYENRTSAFIIALLWTECCPQLILS